MLRLAPNALEANVNQTVNMNQTKPEFRAVIKQDGPWWIGWIEEIPGVNCQEATREVLLESLREALGEALEMNRADALTAAQGDYSEVTISI
jgi:predicted RNase H-like HicB family nuclease